jgi:hypothetical protein
MGKWRYRPTFLDLCTCWRWVVCFTPREIAPGTQRTGDWVWPRTGLDKKEKWKFFPPELRPLGRPALGSRYTDCTIPAHTSLRTNTKIQPVYLKWLPCHVVQHIRMKVTCYFPFIRRGSHRKLCDQQFFHCWVCTRCRCSDSNEPLPSNDTGYTYRHTDWREGFMKNAVEMGLCAIVIKIGSKIQKSTGGGDTETAW